MTTKSSPESLFILLLSCFAMMTSVAFAAKMTRGHSPGWLGAKSYGSYVPPKEARWANAAFEFLRSQDCNRTPFANTEDCKSIVQLPKESISVHVASTSSYGRYEAMLPDEKMNHGQPHDVILVLDLFPGVSFGHLVVVFYLDTRLSRDLCPRDIGTYLENGECLQLAIRKRCKDSTTELRKRKRYFAKRCEANFLPVVHLDTDRNLVKKNQLKCRSDIPDFHACAEMRPEAATSRLVCDSSKENSQGCATSRGSIRTSCKVFEICDQAVILSGGWNRETTGVVYEKNIADMYRLLRHNGFRRKHIKVFYANGVDDFAVPGESSVTAHPSAAKMAFRYHILRMCTAPHCVDSLVIYLNSPTTLDGTILLWDVDSDGLAAEGEKYTLQEMLSDLQDCSARQIQILIDGSYAGELVHAIKQSSRHGNVVVMSSGKGSEYSHGHEFTRYWSSLDDTRICSTDAYWKFHKKVSSSSPMISNKGGIKRTLSGAPCNARPPFSNRELKQDFFGCQSLPTVVWLQHILQESEERLKPFQFT